MVHKERVLLGTQSNGSTIPFIMPLQTDPPLAYHFLPTESHRRQAFSNHGQSLVKLASRGGMSLGEMAAIIEGRSWQPMDDKDAILFLSYHGKFEKP